MTFVSLPAPKLPFLRMRLSLFLPVLAGLLLPAAARAQVTFTGTPTATPLGSGFNAPFAVAVDATGNLFVADTQNNAVKEILAVDGSIPASPTINTLGSGFTLPGGIAVDTHGNVFVSNTYINRVDEILAVSGSIPSVSPQIVTLSPHFYTPRGLALDGSGNLYVANDNGNLVEELVAAGGYNTVNNLAPSVNFFNPQATAVDKSGDVFVADYTFNVVYEIVAVDGVIPASPTVNSLGSGFLNPRGVAVDASGNVYVADTGNNAVKEILAVGGKIPASPTIGTLASGLSAPTGVAVDAHGNVFVADGSGILELGWATGGVNFGAQAIGSPTAAIQFPFTIAAGTTVGSVAVLTTGIAGLDFANASGTTCTAMRYSSTTDCVVNVNFTPRTAGARMGAVVFRDGSGNVLASVPVYGVGSGPQLAFRPGAISTVAGSGAYHYNPSPVAATSAALRGPTAVAVDPAGNLLISDWFHRVIAKVNASTKILSTVAGTSAPCTEPTASPACGNGGPAINATLSNVEGLAVDGAGNWFIADPGDNAIRRVDAATGIITTVAGDGAAGYAGDGSAATGAELNSPNGVAVDGAGNLYIADTDNSVIRMVNTLGVITTVAGGGTPCGAATDAFGDGCPATAATLSNAMALALDSANDIYIVDGGGGANRTSNNLIRRVDAFTGIVTAVAGNGTQGYGGDGGPATAAELNEPQGLAIDSAGDLYIADTNNNRVRKVDAFTHLINTIAGNGTACSPNTQSAPTTTPACGDTGVPTSAMLGPVGLALDGAGNLYIADFNDNRIRKVTVGAPSLSFASTAVNSTSTDSPQRVQVVNIGNQPLTFTGIHYPTDFPESENSPKVIPDDLPNPALCTGSESLIAGQYCFLNVDFSPLSGGKLSEEIILTDNALNGKGVTQSIAVQGTGLKLAQTIDFPIVPAQTIQSTADLSATANSSLTVSFASLTKSICTVAGTKALLIAAGTCTIQATQAGNADYSAAKSVDQSFAVTVKTQTIGFSPISAQTIQSTLNLSATATSSLTVSFASLTKSICTVSGSKASLIAIGACTIQATQAGNSDYSAAKSVDQSFAVNLKSQTIGFPAIPNQTVQSSINLPATATSGLGITFASLTRSICTVAGAKASLIAAGTCTIQATQSGNSDYAAAKPVDQSFSVTAIVPQTINFQAPVNGPIGTTIALSATASSGLPVTLTSLSPSNCSVSGNSVSLVAQGNCIVQASQPGNASNAPATPVDQTIRVIVE